MYSKNVGKYPDEVCHTWKEIRKKICGLCYQEILKALHDRENLGFD